MSYRKNLFNNIGFLMADLPKNIFDAVKAGCDDIESDTAKAIPANANLAGAIEKEYELTGLSDKLEPYLEWLCEEYDSHYDYSRTVDHVDSGGKLWHFSLNDLWVNFQRKHEFNPVHNHSGTLSFVIWVRIPYDLAEEFKQSHEYNNYAKTTSCFQFLVTNNVGQICSHTLPVDRSWEGKIIVFPSKMMHTVYPFYTSDDYRVSVSGNILKKIVD